MRVLAVTNMYPSVSAPAEGSFVEQQVTGLRQIGLDVDVLHVDRSGSGAAAYFDVGRSVRERIKVFRPDLVHVMYGGVMPEIVTRAVRDLPVIVSFCGSDLLGENLHFLRKLMATYGVLASRRAAKRAAGVVVKSRNLEAALPHNVDRRRVRVVPNGIDLNRFTPLDRTECRHSLGWSESAFHVLFASNSGSPVKRPWLAAASVEAAKELGVPAELHLLHNVVPADVPRWLNASNVVLLTSLHEGSPNIIKEALACDVPVVSVDVGDVAERVAGIEGCYIARPDPRSLADCLAKAYIGPVRIQGRGPIEKMSLEGTATRLRIFYEEILENQRYASPSGARRRDESTATTAPAL
jgi:glycosyltransferase involved in cell wall biosynthesis